MSDFNKTLDEWIEEPVEIATINPIMKNGKVVGMEKGTRTTTQRTRYTKLSEPILMSCSALEHYWFIPDPHEHVAHCKNCKKRQFIRAVYECVKDGQIIDRPTSLASS